MSITPVVLRGPSLASMASDVAQSFRSLPAVAVLTFISIPTDSQITLGGEGEGSSLPDGIQTELVHLSHGYSTPELVDALCDFAKAMEKGFGPPGIHNDGKARIVVFQNDVQDGEWPGIVKIMLDISPLSEFVVPKDRPPGTWLSLAPMCDTGCTPVEVDVTRIAEFLNTIGRQLVDVGIPDVQIWVQRRENKSKDEKVAIHGVTIDVDQKAEDIIGTLEAVGVPLPNAYWHTMNGYKLLYAFDREAKGDEAELLATWLTLALEGGDPASWSKAQGQHLPVCLKTKNDETFEVDFPAAQANPTPLALGDFDFISLPARLRQSWGAGATVSAPEREMVEQYLEDLGLPAPDEAGTNFRYSRCPNEDSHSTPCCHVYRNADGTISVYCHASHGGEGKLHWSEHNLLVLAQGGLVEGQRIDAVRDLPATWAGRSLRGHLLLRRLGESSGTKELLRGAERLWRTAKARMEQGKWKNAADKLEAETSGEELEVVRDDPELTDFLRLYEDRESPHLGLGPCNVFFDDRYRALLIHQAGLPPHPVNAAGTGLQIKEHLHEWRSSLSYRVTLKSSVKLQGRGKERHPVLSIKHTSEPDEHYLSHWNKARSGHLQALTALGIPRVQNHEYPVAFVEPQWEIDAATKCIRQVSIPQLKEGDPDFDVVSFFEGLFVEGRLPLASKDDVRRFIMAIAAPLLRELAPGLLGIYWFTGPPGAGKDFLAEMPPAIWREAVVQRPSKAKFDVSVTDETEQKRSFFAAYPAIYGRAKEAGKRKNYVELLIRLAGTDQVPARGMYKDEVHVASTFTFLADSAEDLPERKEISRRTVRINVADTDGSRSKGKLLAEIKAHAPSIICSLKKLVETKPADWYLNQTETQSRPIIPVALSKLLGVTLPEVEGRSLEDLFEAFLHYSKEYGDVEGKKQLEAAKGRKESKAAQTFRSYRYSHFADLVGGEDGYKALLREFGTLRRFQMALDRETDYPKVKRHQLPYLRVQINGSFYAFRLVMSNRNFILEKELEYCDKLGIEPIAPVVGAVVALSESTTSEQAPSPPVQPSPEPESHSAKSIPSTGPISFSEDEICSNAAGSRRKGG